jgi:hypothetical protein
MLWQLKHMHVHTYHWSESLSSRNQFKELGTGGRSLKKEEGVDWIHLAQNRGQWWTIMNAVKTLGSLKTGDFLKG